MPLSPRAWPSPLEPLQPHRDDLEAVDFALTQSLKAVRNIHLRGVATDEAFRDLGLGGFEVATADGGRAGLPTPGGSAREVTLDNRLEFADMAEEFKMREYRVPVRTALCVGGLDGCCCCSVPLLLSICNMQFLPAV